MFLVIKKSTLIKLIVIALVCISAVGIIVLSCIKSNTELTQASLTDKKIPIYGVVTEKKDLAISFDASWGSEKTASILDILDKYNAKATFFLVGIWIKENPDLVKEIDARGHTIGNHSATHPHFNSLSKEQKMAEIEGVNKQIFDLIGKEVRYFRAPFGEYNNELIEVCDSLDMQVIQWTVDTLDWKGISASEINTRVVNKASEGSIILCHNDGKNTVEALPLMLLSMQNKGYNYVNMEDLVLKENYDIDNNGMQKSQNNKHKEGKNEL